MSPDWPNEGWANPVPIASSMNPNQIQSTTGFTTTFLLAGAMCLLGCITLFVLESRSSERVGDHKTAEAHFRRSRRVYSALEGLLKL